MEIVVYLWFYITGDTPTEHPLPRLHPTTVGWLTGVTPLEMVEIRTLMVADKEAIMSWTSVIVSMGYTI